MDLDQLYRAKGRGGKNRNCLHISQSIYRCTWSSFYFFGTIYYYYYLVSLVEAALDVEGSHPRPWQGTRFGALHCYGGKEDTAIGRYALSVTLIVTVSQPGVANVTGTRRSVRYLYTTLISTYLHIYAQWSVRYLGHNTAFTSPAAACYCTNYKDLTLCSKLLKKGFPCF